MLDLLILPVGAGQVGKIYHFVQIGHLSAGGRVIAHRIKNLRVGDPRFALHIAACRHTMPGLGLGALYIVKNHTILLDPMQLLFGFHLFADVVHPCRCDRLQLITAVEPGELSCLRNHTFSMSEPLFRKVFLSQPAK